MKYTTCGKQVLRNGENFAQACDNGAATLIADVLNARPRVVAQRNDQGDVISPITYRSAPLTHHTTRQHDEYACSCGARWDVAEGETHP